MSISEDELDSDGSLPDDDPFAAVNARPRPRPLAPRPALIQPNRTPAPTPVFSSGPSAARGLTTAAHVPVASTSKPPSVASTKPVTSRREKRRQYAARKVERDAQLERLYPTWHLDSTPAWPKPTIVYTTDASVAVAELEKLQGPLAFDVRTAVTADRLTDQMEWKPSTRVGVENPTSVLQFADSRRCLVFHLLERRCACCPRRHC